jgi:acyl carrier protein
MEQLLTNYIEEELREVGEDIQLRADDDLVLIGFDSVAYVRLVAFLKDRFGIRVPDSDVTVQNFGTVEAIARYLESNDIDGGDQV